VNRAKRRLRSEQFTAACAHLRAVCVLTHREANVLSSHVQRGPYGPRKTFVELP